MTWEACVEPMREFLTVVVVVACVQMDTKNINCGERKASSQLLTSGRCLEIQALESLLLQSCFVPVGIL